MTGDEKLKALEAMIEAQAIELKTLKGAVNLLLEMISHGFLDRDEDDETQSLLGPQGPELSDFYN